MSQTGTLRPSPEVAPPPPGGPAAPAPVQGPLSPAPSENPHPKRPAPPPDAEVMIRVRGLGKRFKMYAHPWARVGEWLTGNRLNRHQDFWALRGVSFELRRGECLGVVGANGSGKSTLLKMINGSLYPTEGTFEVRGRVLSLLELGAGLNPQLTGRENVENSARLLAFPPEYAREKMAEIQEFAELGAFFDRPARFYSSGMTVRLAFSMFACFKPEVFIVDEALAVGDVYFQQRCVQRIDRMLAEGTTLLFVSHDTQAVQRLSHRVVVLNRGRVHFEGTPEEGVSRYFALIRADMRGRGAALPRVAAPTVVAPGSAREAILRHNILTEHRNRHGTGEVTVEAASFHDHAGRPSSMVIPILKTATITLLIRAHRASAHPSAGINLYDRLANLVFAAGTRQLGVPIPAMAAGQERIVTFKLTLNVHPGIYTFSVGCSEPCPTHPDAGIVHDRHEGLGPIHVVHDTSEGRPFFGIAQLPLEITVTS